MASVRTLRNSQDFDRSVVIQGHFYPKGALAITSQKITAGTFLRTAQGVITLTLDDPVRTDGYWYPEVDLNMGTPNGSYAMITGVSQASNGIITVTIGTFDSGHNAADIAAHASNVVTLKMRVKIRG